MTEKLLNRNKCKYRNRNKHAGDMQMFGKMIGLVMPYFFFRRQQRYALWIESHLM